MKTELVTTLKRKATDILETLTADQEPVMITHHGVPSAYLIDVKTYQKMQDRLEILEGIARGEKAILDERMVTNAQAKKKLARWLK